MRLEGARACMRQIWPCCDPAAALTRQAVEFTQGYVHNTPLAQADRAPSPTPPSWHSRHSRDCTVMRCVCVISDWGQPDALQPAALHAAGSSPGGQHLTRMPGCHRGAGTTYATARMCRHVRAVHTMLPELSAYQVASGCAVQVLRHKLCGRRLANAHQARTGTHAL